MSHSRLQTAFAPRRGQIVAAMVTAVTLTLLAACALPFGSVWMGVTPGFVLCFGGVTLFADVVTAAVLFSQAHAARDRSLVDLGAAFLFPAGIMLPYLLAFPGVLVARPELGGPPTALWLWSVWHLGFALGVMRYAARPRETTGPAPRVGRAVLRIGALVAAIALATPALSSHVPAVLIGMDFSLFYRWLVGPLLVSTNGAALVLVLMRLRGRTTISIWLAVAVLTAILDVVLTVMGGRRFTFSWYVAKSLSLGTSLIVLGALLTELTSVFRKISSLNVELFHTAFHDGLTRLPNREMFTNRLLTAMQRARTEPAFTYAVMFVDLDRFKLVNDSLGHRAGDLLLIEVANRLAGCIRRGRLGEVGDTLARIGGDEFAILIDGIDNPEFLEGVAERIAEAMQQPVWIGGQEIFSTCSVGVVSSTASYALPEELLRDADIAMYEAKRAGIGRHAIFADHMRGGVLAALKLQTDLKNALARGEFFLVYQPICAAIGGEITGVEALMRWQHPERGLVPPGAFIPAAEETGLIRDMGAWLLREACAQMQAWREHGAETPMRLSVNTSAVELKDAGFTARLRRILAETRLDPRCLQLEMTEAIFLENPHTVGEILNGIRALGVRVALDDFGTGYSSLSYLDRYPMDTLKIDQSFVARMLSQTRTMAIVQTVVRLGRALALDVVAEGVETEAQLDVLRAAGCGSVQGYFLGRPMPAAQVEQCLAEQARRLVAAPPVQRSMPRLVSSA